MSWILLFAAVAIPFLAVAEETLRGNAENGRVLYGQFCASCHGSNGRGDGPVGRVLNPPPANHTDPVRMGALSDAHLYTVISKGGASVGLSPMMAPWSGLVSDCQIRDVIAHVRTLSGT